MIIYSITFCRPPAPATMQPQRLFFRQLLLVVTLLVAQPVAAFTLSPGDVLVGRGFNTDSSREGDVIRVNVADGTFEVLVSGGMVRSPNHIATDHAGRIIIAEWQNGPIIAVEPDGGDQVIVGSGDLLKFPRGVAVGPDGHLYVSAGGFSDPDGRVVRIDMNDYDPLEPEANQQLVGTGGLLSYPGGIVVGPLGNLFVGATSADKIVMVDPDSFNPEEEEANQTIVGSRLFPRSLAMDHDGTVFASFLNDDGAYHIDPASYSPQSPQANSTQIASFVQDCGVCSIATEASGQVLLLESINSPPHHWLVRIDPSGFDSENPLANQTQLASIEDVRVGSVLAGLWVVPVPEPTSTIAQITALLTLGFLARRSGTGPTRS